MMHIRKLRRAAGITQTELAEKMGVIPSCVSSWEREITLPRARQLPQLAQVLDCTINDLFEQPPHPEA